jgi:hypothetical protein
LSILFSDRTRSCIGIAPANWFPSRFLQTLNITINWKSIPPRIYQDKDSLLTELARSGAEIGNQAQLRSNCYSTNLYNWNKLFILNFRNKFHFCDQLYSFLFVYIIDLRTYKYSIDFRLDMAGAIFPIKPLEVKFLNTWLWSSLISLKTKGLSPTYVFHFMRHNVQVYDPWWIRSSIAGYNITTRREIRLQPWKLEVVMNNIHTISFNWKVLIS